MTYTTRKLTLIFDVHTFMDEDYDEDDHPIGIEVIDSMEPASLTTELPDYLVRQLGDFLLHSSSGHYMVADELPKFLTHYRPEVVDKDGKA